MYLQQIFFSTHIHFLYYFIIILTHVLSLFSSDLQV